MCFWRPVGFARGLGHSPRLMGARSLAALLFFAALTAPAPALADVASELDALKQDYRYSRFDAVLEGAERLLDSGRLSDAQREQVHLYAGAAAFSAQDTRAATRHFTGLLRANPGMRLDPFLFPPSMVAFVDDLRARLGPELSVLELERRLKADAAKASAQPPELPVLFHFLPFGIPQLQQQRTAFGIAFAVSEAVAVTLSVVSYGSYYGAMSRRRTEVNGVAVTEWGFAERLQGAAQMWRTLNLVSTVGFYALWALGITDALVHRGARLSVGASTSGAAATLEWSF